MTLHTVLSYVKSAVRICGFMALGAKLFMMAGLVPMLAEVVGVLEELPGAYVGTKTTGSGQF